MATPHFRPTPVWQHALDAPLCPCHLLLVARTDNQVVGWCRLFPEECEDGTDQVELGIGVVRNWRQKGIGGKLLHHALKWTTRRGFAHVVLTTRADNEPAIQLFTRSGFQVIGGKDELLEMACLPEYIPEQGVKW